MPDHTIIAATSATLQGLFEGAITNDPAPALNGLLVDLRSPRDLRLDNDSLGLSVWLYRVDATTDRRSVLPPSLSPGARRAEAALALELHYLITPIAAEPEDEQAVLGRVLETLRDHPVLTGPDLPGPLAYGEVRLSLETLTLEESTRLFAALQEPYRLAVAVLARPLAPEP